REAVSSLGGPNPEGHRPPLLTPAPARLLPVTRQPPLRSRFVSGPRLFAASFLPERDGSGGGSNHGHEADPPHLFGSHPTRGGPGLQRNHAFRILPHQRLQGKVWDSVSGDEVLSLAHKHIVKSVNFTQDSNHLLTAGNDKLLRIFDLSNTDAAPQEIAGHGAAIKKALWCNDDKQILSAADDKTVRLWDRTSMEEVKTLTFNTSVSSMEYMADGEILVITYGKTIAFYNALSLELIKIAEAPAPINSASLHPEKDFFVAGGEDFKLYKFDYSTQEELESYKGHFGPVHCVRFSPDGELYASGSEDGTLRLWQTAVGKTYGLWKCVLPEDLGADNSEQMYGTTPEIKA
uniref:Serine-threonine kinase receptor-associated protein n=1 Tax=Oryzias sinensis TaxID=183150 RepID=A0A8C7ZWY6_9TELE